MAATQKVLVNKIVNAPNGAPAEALAVRVTARAIRGTAFQTETVSVNGTLIFATQYPAGTGYAARRLAHWTK